MTLKFAFVASCLVIAIASYMFCNSKRDWAWLVGGLGFTVGADYFLILHNLHIPGVAVFCFAHACYIGRSRCLRVSGMIGLFLFVAIAVFAGLFLDSIFVLASLYACLFAANIFVNILAFKRPHLPKRNHALMLVGLCLFALCDVNVMLVNLPFYLGIYFSVEIYNFAHLLIWVFYLPSQLVLAVSSVSTASTSSTSSETISTLDTETS